MVLNPATLLHFNSYFLLSPFLSHPVTNNKKSSPRTSKNLTSGRLPGCFSPPEELYRTLHHLNNNLILSHISRDLLLHTHIPTLTMGQDTSLNFTYKRSGQKSSNKLWTSFCSVPLSCTFFFKAQGVHIPAVCRRAVSLGVPSCVKRKVIKRTTEIQRFLNSSILNPNQGVAFDPRTTGTTSLGKSRVAT